MAELIGKSIGQYQILEFIARGVTSYVYKGFQPSMNRYVAIKVLSPAEARHYDRINEFHNLARIMAQFDHPNILRVYDDGQEGQLAFVVSRYVTGGTLKEQMARFRSPQAALQILRPITEALMYIHNQEHVHGNLKPENVLLEEGKPLLIDFGSHVVPVVRDVYHSPEQAQGSYIDSRTDVYALGVLLFEMLVGTAPKVGTLPAPRHYRPDLPEAVEKVILKAMATNPAYRFQDVNEFYQALATAVPAAQPSVPTTHPIRQQPAPTPPQPVSQQASYPTQEPVRDNTFILWVMLIALLGLITACVLGVIFFDLQDIFPGSEQAAIVPSATDILAEQPISAILPTESPPFTDTITLTPPTLPAEQPPAEILPTVLPTVEQPVEQLPIEVLPTEPPLVEQPSENIVPTLLPEQPPAEVLPTEPLLFEQPQDNIAPTLPEEAPAPLPDVEVVVEQPPTVEQPIDTAPLVAEEQAALPPEESVSPTSSICPGTAVPALLLLGMLLPWRRKKQNQSVGG